MPKQFRFHCIDGYLNGTQVKYQDNSFSCIENIVNLVPIFSIFLLADLSNILFSTSPENHRASFSCCSSVI